MAERVNKNVDWLVDDTGRVTGYQRFPGDKQALVSGAGIAYATLASTPGTTPGERRTLNDGPDAGAGLVWAIPEGTSTYAWCWAIYPLASYL